jgi:exopolysaccharide production protein ExoQ
MLILLRSGPAMRRYRKYIVTAFAIFATLYALATMQVVPGLQTALLGPVVAFTGKTLTFSGRTEIWQILARSIARHPILGSGYGAYWGAGPVPSSPSYEFILSSWGSWPSEGHNGYYDVTNDLGFVGLLCLVGYMFLYLRQSIELLRVDRAQGTLLLALLFQQTLLNLSESTWLDLDNFSFTIMTAATVALARALVEQRRATRAAAAAPSPGIRRPVPAAGAAGVAARLRGRRGV